MVIVPCPTYFLIMISSVVPVSLLSCIISGRGAMAQSAELDYRAITGWYDSCSSMGDCSGATYQELSEPLFLSLNTCYVNPRSSTPAVSYLKQTSSGVLMEFHVVFTVPGQEIMPQACDADGACVCGQNFDTIIKPGLGDSCDQIFSFTYVCTSRELPVSNTNEQCYIGSVIRLDNDQVRCSLVASIESFPPTHSPTVAPTLRMTRLPSAPPSTEGLAQWPTESPIRVETIRPILDFQPSPSPTARMPMPVPIPSPRQPTNQPTAADSGGDGQFSMGIILVLALVPTVLLVAAYFANRPKGGYCQKRNHTLDQDTSDAKISEDEYVDDKSQPKKRASKATAMNSVDDSHSVNQLSQAAETSASTARISNQSSGNLLMMRPVQESATENYTFDSGPLYLSGNQRIASGQWSYPSSGQPSLAFLDPEHQAQMGPISRVAPFKTVPEPNFYSMNEAVMLESNSGSLSSSAGVSHSTLSSSISAPNSFSTKQWNKSFRARTEHERVMPLLTTQDQHREARSASSTASGYQAMSEGSSCATSLGSTSFEQRLYMQQLLGSAIGEEEAIPETTTDRSKKKGKRGVE